MDLLALNVSLIGDLACFYSIHCLLLSGSNMYSQLSSSVIIRLRNSSPSFWNICRHRWQISNQVDLWTPVSMRGTLLQDTTELKILFHVLCAVPMLNWAATSSTVNLLSVTTRDSTWESGVLAVTALPDLVIHYIFMSCVEEFYSFVDISSVHRLTPTRFGQSAVYSRSTHSFSIYKSYHSPLLFPCAMSILVMWLYKKLGDC